MLLRTRALLTDCNGFQKRIWVKEASPILRIPLKEPVQVTGSAADKTPAVRERVFYRKGEAWTTQRTKFVKYEEN